MDLAALGWNSGFDRHFADYAGLGFCPGRVFLEHQHMYRIYTEQGEMLAQVSGKMRHQAEGRGDYPAVGDWVVVRAHEGEQRATIHAILPRFSKFSRKTAGYDTEEQIVAANVDTVFLVCALNNDFNPRRMERYLILAWESGANPVIVLNKADVCPDVGQKIAEMEAVAFGVPVLAVSALTMQGMEALAPYLHKGRTVALLGSSGAGKSSIINRLIGSEVQKVHEVREGDDRGRHTTTHRELFLLPQGGCIIDTPGMRELQLWHAEDGLQGTFHDIEELARQCFFSDCRHHGEPKCAVKHALRTGMLDPGRFQSYRKMEKELAHLAAKERQKAKMLEKDNKRKKKSRVADTRD